MSSCGQCIYYAPTRSTETGHILTSKPGRCMYPVLNLPVPQCYDQSELEQDVIGARSPVWPESGDKCLCFEAKPGRAQAVEAKAETLL